MNAFVDFLRFICLIVITLIMIFLFAGSVDTLHYAKQNNVLLRKLCVENGLNVDSLISTTQNDTLNLKVCMKGE